MNNDYLVIHELHKQFPRKGQPALHVIDGLDVAVEEGALLSILGPSGCGKSTLLNILLGLESPSSGGITLAGREVTARSKSDLKISMIFQDPRLLNWRTVRENVALPLIEMGLERPVIAQRVEHYLDMVGLASFRDYFPLQLSGGMRQRVALARGLAVEPDLLLADEPFSALDEMTARNLRGEFLRMWRETNRTIIFVTHNIREAIFLSTRMLMVTRRPAQTHLDLEIDIPYPRDPESDELFEIEKQVTRDFVHMEEAAVQPAAI